MRGCAGFAPGTVAAYFPSFSEGLSLRADEAAGADPPEDDFPSFSEGLSLRAQHAGGPFTHRRDFPSFSEGLSLREAQIAGLFDLEHISLPFRRDFH